MSIWAKPSGSADVSSTSGGWLSCSNRHWDQSAKLLVGPALLGGEYSALRCQPTSTAWIHPCVLCTNVVDVYFCNVQRLEVRWLLDPMHIEVNVAKNLLAHLYGVNDSITQRHGAQEVGMLRSCWITVDGSKPVASWVLPKDVLRRMNGMICNMKFPSHYGAGFRGCTTSESCIPPIGLKSHDYHKLMQHVLPVVLRICDTDSTRRFLRQGIYDMCTIFRYFLEHFRPLSLQASLSPTRGWSRHPTPDFILTQDRRCLQMGMRERDQGGGHISHEREG
jgi:hypothetical protein